MELSVKLWDTARVAKPVHSLERDDEIEAGGDRFGPIGILKSAWMKRVGSSNFLRRLRLSSSICGEKSTNV